MKTSTKIVICLLIVVFTVPFFLAVTLKKKIEKGEYTVEKIDKEENMQEVNGKFSTFKAIKVKAPRPMFLEVRLKQSNDMNYTYYRKNDLDSVRVSNINDTLVIEFVSKVKDRATQDRGWGERLVVSVNLPVVNQLVVDGAAVVLDSYSTPDNNLSVTIRNNGELRDQSKGGNQQIGRVLNSPVHEKNNVINLTAGKTAAITKIKFTNSLPLQKQAINIIQSTVHEQLLDVLVKVM